MDYLVTYANGRMVMIDGAASITLARAAAYRIAEQNGWAPTVKNASELSMETAAILRRGNPETIKYDPIRR